jgi:phage tail sheath protein FI
MEKAVKRVAKFFVFEPNTKYTRDRVKATLDPFFRRIQAADGLYEYLLVCDERNNTPEVIDNNTLVVDVYLKPTRTAEFILVNFYATRTDTNFEELAGKL